MSDDTGSARILALVRQLKEQVEPRYRGIEEGTTNEPVLPEVTDKRRLLLDGADDLKRLLMQVGGRSIEATALASVYQRILCEGPTDLLIRELRQLLLAVETSLNTDQEPLHPSLEAASSSGNSHSPDFRSAFWNGETYSFTLQQARCIEILWNCWVRRTYDVGEQYILTEVESNQNRLSDVFDKGKHPAWGAMIIRGKTKGAFRLAGDHSPKV